MAPQNKSPLVNHVKPNLEFLQRLRKRYAKARKKERTAILREFVTTTGYHRKCASALLHGNRQWRDPKQPLRRARRNFYTKADRRAVLWLIELGSRVKKIYDQPKTPYQRVLDSPDVSEACKQKPHRGHAKLDVAQIKQEWDRRLAALKPTSQW